MCVCVFLSVLWWAHSCLKSHSPQSEKSIRSLTPTLMVGPVITNLACVCCMYCTCGVFSQYLMSLKTYDSFFASSSDIKRFIWVIKGRRTGEVCLSDGFPLSIRILFHSMTCFVKGQWSYQNCATVEQWPAPKTEECVDKRKRAPLNFHGRNCGSAKMGRRVGSEGWRSERDTASGSWAVSQPSYICLVWKTRV